VRGDGRSRRVAVVPDVYLNPAAGAPDRLAQLAEAGWGVVALPQPGLEPDVEAALLAAVVDQLAAFLHDGYEVALAEPDDPAARRLAELLAADGRRIAASVTS
jgi:DNA-binding transcriptional LysR family regulator